MKVISTTDLSHGGNDCYIYKSISLIEEFEMYTVVTAEKVVGWQDRQSISCDSKTTCDLQQAKYMYRQAGGILTNSNNN
jgi:hypothetical protein